MTHDELITVARTHTVDLPKLSGEPWANQDTLNKVKVVDTVIVSFESEQYPRKIMILFGEGVREVHWFLVDAASQTRR
jgi:hypothetical protein